MTSADASSSSSMASFDGFLGHFDMLCDDERNEKFSEAIRRAAADISAARSEQSDPLHALDLGSGCGLLGLLAWQTGVFGRVVFLESSPQLAVAARSNIQRNEGAAEVCTVWEGHSSNLLSQPLVSTKHRPFDLCVFELFDSLLLGEGVLPTPRHALATPYLDRARTLLVPANARIVGRLFDSEAVFARQRLWSESSQVGDPRLPTAWLRCDGLQSAEEVHVAPYLKAGLLRFVSEPFDVFAFDFAALPEGGRQQKLLVKLEESALAHGVALWFDAGLYAGVRLSTGPLPGVPARDHWRQSVVCFKTPVHSTTAVQLEACHDDDAVWFTPNMELGGLPPPPPACHCGLHAQTSRRRLGMLRDAASSSWMVSPERRFLAFGDGGFLPAKLAAAGVQVVCVGRSMLNDRLVGALCRATGVEERVRVAQLEGSVVPRRAGPPMFHAGRPIG